MKNRIKHWQPKHTAIMEAQKIRALLDSGREFSPGQWQLLEDKMDRIYVDPFIKEEYKVSDFI